MRTVTIVIAYQKGTSPILSVCLESIKRHTAEVMHQILILTRRDGELEPEVCALAESHRAAICELDIPQTNAVHGTMLDLVIPSNIPSDYVLTMDSDCFPIADGWLSDLLGMMDNGAKLTGILHPWAPPPPELLKNTIEYRVRSQHCWEGTHVACQLVKVSDLVDLVAAGANYKGGDDTGLLIPLLAKKARWKIDGFKPTRCPKPAMEDFDPEFNRYVAQIFGDKVFHLGGYTRTAAFGDTKVFDNNFGWATQKILDNQGAEFLLDDSLSYKFKFDKEEEVAQEKMQRLFGMKNSQMKG